MNKEIVSSPALGEQFQRVEHPSGLTILLCPMEGYSTAYAMFAAKVGSIDTTFKTQHEEDFVEVPPGIAHFLEHKMFECEDGDAFAKYAKTGASANAFTSFDRTAYLFSCTGNFRESMEILLDFVSRPYFTPETVQKEQGIIGQEIRMYDDDPGWRSLFNLLQALYHVNPVRLDIAGTTDSIAEITDQLLYRCYHTFYSLGNMVLTVAGNFRPEDVLEAADKILKKGEDIRIQWRKAQEPREVAQSYVEQPLSVSTPLFQLGFKGTAGDSLQNLKRQIADEILLEILCGESSTLYRQLYDSGLINGTFEYEVLAGRDYLCCMYGGESRDPKKVRDAICGEVRRLMAEGIDPEAFRRCRKATYGRYIGMFSRVDSIASLMMLSHFSGLGNMYEILDWVKELTREELENRLREDMDPQYSALSIITPMA
ncbi:MAG: insulinase family protein [Angelakisella sp.]|jgi:predicted Zn-dependent peptidase|nr:insulinase family protein [Angelakisella sp.]